MTVKSDIDPQQNGINLILFSPKGCLYTLWLPGVADGTFKFDAGTDSQELDFLSVEAENNRWIAKCRQNAEIKLSDGSSVQSIPLSHLFVSYVIFENRRYLLYAESTRKEDKVLRRYYVEESSVISIGRSPGSDIWYQNSFISRTHAKLQYKSKEWFLLDTNSGNGVFLNEKRIHPDEVVPLQIGDRIHILGLKLLIGAGFLCINDGLDSLRINPLKLVPFSPAGIAVPKPPEAIPFRKAEFSRLPQRRTQMRPKTIAIEGPPVQAQSDKMPLLLRFGSPMVMSGNSLISGNYTSILSMLMFPLLTNRFTEKQKKEYEKLRTEKYMEYLRQKEREIWDEIQYEQSYLNTTYPPLSSSPSSLFRELWSRGKRSSEFLKLRIGSGSVLMNAEILYPKERFSLDHDPLEDAMYQVAEKQYRLNEVPICLDLIQEFLISISGQQQERMELFKQFLLQLTFWHSFDELKIVLIVDTDNIPDGKRIRFLPHIWSDDRSIRFIAADKTDAFLVNEHLNACLEKNLSGNKNVTEILKVSPYYVVLAWDKKIFDSMNVFERICREERNLGFSILTFFDNPFKDAQTVVNVTGGLGNSVSRLQEALQPDIEFSRDVYNNVSYDTYWKLISNISIKDVESSSSFPKMLSFLEMYQAGKVEHLNAIRRWKENNPAKSLAVPVGVSADGTVFELDLHEKQQGPHGLVAGMTGSGKSEFLITYILSLALNFTPNEVSFVLIDYKGGGLVGAFADYDNDLYLPHLAGTITNLDGSAVQRAILSIESEMRKRQIIFNEAKKKLNEGTMDIYFYQSLYRQGLIDKPLPHLFIISDEFAELKQQEPEFLDALISAARIGRSLGIHLILATQKPSGVVNDQISSNSKFRVCLKVQTKSDSDEMLRRPDAAQIKETGRFFLQVGYDEFFEQGQSAWCGAPYAPSEEVIENRDDAIEFLDNCGQRIFMIRPEKKVRDSGQSQLTVIVRYLIEAASKENVSKYFLWHEPLPKTLELQDLKKEEVSDNTISLTLGVVDDPSNQTQFPYVLNLSSCRNLLIVGGNKSGKTTYIESLLFAAVSSYSPDQLHFYILDFSSKLLTVFSKAPHCGGVWTVDQEETISRFFIMLTKTVENRKKLFNEAGVSTYEAYNEIHPLPLLLVVIDNYPALKSWQKGKNLDERMAGIIRESNPAGVRFIFSVNNMDDISYRNRKEIEDRIVFSAKSRFELEDILGVKCRMTPEELPGHGLFKYGDRSLAFAAAKYAVNHNEQTRTKMLREFCQDLNVRYQGTNRPEQVLSLDKEQTYTDFIQDIPSFRIPLGYDVKNIRKVSMPFKQLYCLAVHFGNPLNKESIFKNFLQAAIRDDMKVIVLKQDHDSVFDKESLADIFQLLREPVILSDTLEDGTVLWNTLASETAKRKKIRDQFALSNGISTQDNSLMEKASGYLRSHSEPLLILIEDFKEFSSNLDEKYQNGFINIFNKGRGYNYYFIGGFNPADDSFSAPSAMQKAFTQDGFALLNGGCFDKTNLVNLPSEYRRITEISSAPQSCLLHYRNQVHSVWMPMQVIEEQTGDPDDLPII